MREKVLFLGGPADGQRRDVDRADEVVQIYEQGTVPDPPSGPPPWPLVEAVTIQAHVYRRVVLRLNSVTRRWLCVMVHNEVGDDWAVAEALLAGYRLDTKKPAATLGPGGPK